ncbi:MAG TPA: hypothetical protein VGW10_04150 [Solirubrobacteraceae bacterium]|nr:hypothetical protein [Solirubrobacteraceae bacterium]
MNSRPAAVLACLLTLSLAACGGGDDSPKTAEGKDGKPPIGAAEDFKVKKSLVSKGASAGDASAVEDYVPEGELVADSGFRPERDGFGFENYGNDVEPQNLGPPQVQDLFGDQVCLVGSGAECQLIPAAQEWMENQNEGMAGGHCQGFSVTALRMYNELIAPSDYGARVPAALEIVGNVDLQASIAEHFTYQFLPPIVEGRVKGAPSEVLQQLVDALNTGEELYTLGVYKPDLSGGHAITPFAVEDKGDGEYAILVYDNNFPGTTRAVQVNTNDETWNYVSGTNPDDLGQVYEGSAETETLELDPTLPVEEEYSPCPFCGGGSTEADAEKGSVLEKSERYMEITLGGDPRNHPHLVFTDDDGRRTGVVDGKFLQEIPEVEVVKTFATRNWEGAPEPRFRFPEGKEYTITVDGTDLEKPTTTNVDLVGNGLFIEIEEIKLAPGQKDEMALPGGYGITYQSNGTDEMAPNLYAGLEEDGAAYNFAASAVGVKQGSTLSLLVEQEEKVVILDSTGAEGVLDGDGVFILQLTKLDSKGRISQWQAGEVLLNGAKEEKAAFEYGTSPRRGKPLPIVILDKDAEEKDVIEAKPEP